MPIVRIQSPFRRGLSNDNNPNALDSLKEGFGFMCSEAGLVPYESVDYISEVNSSHSAHGLMSAAGKLFCVNSCTSGLEIYNEDTSAFEALSATIGALGASVVDLGSSSDWTYSGASSEVTWSSGTVLVEEPLSADTVLYQQIWTGTSDAVAPAYALEVESCFSHALSSCGEKSEGYVTYELYYNVYAPSNRMDQFRSGSNITLMYPREDWSSPIYFRILLHSGFVGRISGVTLKPLTSIADSLQTTGAWETANTEQGAILLLKDYTNSHMYFYDIDMNSRTGIVKCKHTDTDTSTVHTICSHRDGRLYMAGRLYCIFDTNTSGEFRYWEMMWDELGAGLVDAPVGLNDKDNEYIYWSNIGMDDVPELIIPNLLYTDVETVKDRFERNEAGWMRWPFRGSVWAARPMGNEVIFYGDQGILALEPNNADVPMNVRVVADFGIAGMFSVCAANTGHYFLDHQGALWKMAGQELQYIGYKELLSTLDLDVARLVAHPIKDRVFITDGTDSYFFANGALLECPQRINSLVAKDNQLYAAGKNTVGSFTLETGVIDFDSREVKSIRRLTFDGYSGAGWKAKVSRRLQTADWLTTGWLTLPYDGSITGTEFIFELYTSGSSSYYLNSLVVEVDNDPRNYALADWLYTS